MTLSRALPLVVALAVLPIGSAVAQFPAGPGGWPSPGTGGGSPGVGGGSPWGSPPPQQGPPPACQQILALRDETGKHGKALEAAGKKKASPEEMCKLFKPFIAAEAKMVKALEEHSRTCGVPPEAIQQVKAQHAKYTEISKKVCEVAAQGPRPSGPSLSEALGTTPMIPDSTGPKRGAGTFETLQGSPLTR
jgi:hypothetical protein